MAVDKARQQCMAVKINSFEIRVLGKGFFVFYPKDSIALDQNDFAFLKGIGDAVKEAEIIQYYLWKG
jgi:hypothetical protein